MGVTVFADRIQSADGNHGAEADGEEDDDEVGLHGGHAFVVILSRAAKHGDVRRHFCVCWGVCVWVGCVFVGFEAEWVKLKHYPGMIVKQRVCWRWESVYAFQRVLAMLKVDGVAAASRLTTPPRASAIARHPPAIMRRTSSIVAGDG